MEFDFNFLFPSPFLIFPNLLSIYEQFLFQVWKKSETKIH
jgi:hypothetical protein